MNLGRKSSVLTALFLWALLLTPTLRALAQAGRKNPPPQPAASPGNADTQPAYVPDPNRDEYKLVFPKGYGNSLDLTTVPKILLGKKAREQDAERGWKDYQYSFIDQINEAGAQGYRLVSLALYPKMAILRRDQIQHEYEMFETISPHYFSDAEFERKYAPLARKGFRVDECFYLWGGCDTPRRSRVEQCEYRRFFVVERERHVRTANEFEVLTPHLSFNAKKIETELTEQISTAVKSGLSPTHMITRFEVLVQSAAGRDDSATTGYELQVAAGNLKRVNELAQQGYRLMLRPYEFEVAVMYRKMGQGTPVSYARIREKKLEQELPRLQKQGAIYRMTYGCHGIWNGTMIFEQPSVSDGKQLEYRVLTLELQRVENVAEQKVEFQLTPASKETMETLNRLAKEGFEVRDLFACDMSDYEKKGLSRVKILLERVE